MSIQHKRTATVGRVPTTSEVDRGELFINSEDGTMFTKSESDAIVQLGGGGGGGGKPINSFEALWTGVNSTNLWEHPKTFKNPDGIYIKTGAQFADSGNEYPDASGKQNTTPYTNLVRSGTQPMVDNLTDLGYDKARDRYYSILYTAGRNAQLYYFGKEGGRSYVDIRAQDNAPTGVDSDANHIYVVGKANDRVYLYNAADRAYTGTSFSVHTQPQRISVSDDKDEMWIYHNNGTNKRVARQYRKSDGGYTGLEVSFQNHIGNGMAVDFDNQWIYYNVGTTLYKYAYNGSLLATGTLATNGAGAYGFVIHEDKTEWTTLDRYSSNYTAGRSITHQDFVGDGKVVGVPDPLTWLSASGYRYPYYLKIK